MAAGLGSVNAAALTNIASMKGSDSLYELTTSAIDYCPTCFEHLTYVGMGSAAGESAMLPYNAAATQTIAPMSSFLDGAICSVECEEGCSFRYNGITTVQADGTSITYTRGQVEAQACGLVIGLEGVSVYGSANTATHNVM